MRLQRSNNNNVSKLGKNTNITINFISSKYFKKLHALTYVKKNINRGNFKHIYVHFQMFFYSLLSESQKQKLYLKM